MATSAMSMGNRLREVLVLCDQKEGAPEDGLQLYRTLKRLFDRAHKEMVANGNDAVIARNMQCDHYSVLSEVLLRLEKREKAVKYAERLLALATWDNLPISIRFCATHVPRICAAVPGHEHLLVELAAFLERFTYMNDVARLAQQCRGLLQ